MLKQSAKSLRFGVILMISIFLTLGLSVSIQSLLAAWTAPNDNPPTNNVSDLLLGGSLGVGTNMSVIGSSIFTGNIGVGAMANSVVKLLVQATGGQEGLKIISSDWSPFVIRDMTDSTDLFRVKQDGNICIGDDCKNAWPNGGGVTAHNLLTGLTDDDHPQYLRTDGTRAVTSRQIFSDGLTVTSGKTICLGGVCNSTWPAGGAADGTGPWATSTGAIYYNSGNVGIGTNNPSKKLQIVDGATNLIFGTAVANTLGMDGVTPVSVDGISIKSTGVAGINLQSITPGGCSGYTMTGNSGASTGYLFSCGDASDIALGTPLGGINIVGKSYLQLTSNTSSININSKERMHIYGQKELFLLNEGGVYVDHSWGGANAGNLFVSKNVTAQGYYYSSDKNLKKNIKPISGALDKITRLDGVNFEWKDGSKKDVGVIAQDVEKVFPELVKTNKDTGYKSVEYGNLVAPLIEAIKEQQKMIKDLQKEVKELKQIK